MFQDALELHRQGRLEEAAKGYHAVLATEPNHVESLVHLGVLQLGQGLSAEARRLLQQAVALAPDSVDAHANLAAALLASGLGEEAIREYHRALGLSPNAAHLQYALASCLQSLERYEEATAAYEMALAAEPGHPEANYGLATLFAKLERLDEAALRYHAALSADPDFAEASYGLGALLIRRESFEEAIAWFHRALDVDPDYLDARLGLGQALQRLDRDDAAMAEIRLVLKADPDNVTAHYTLGVLLHRNHRDEEAVPHFEKVLALDPDHVRAMTGLADTLLMLERPAEAIALCRRAISVQPEFARAHTVLGAVLAEVGNLAEAVTESERALDLAPRRPEFCYNLVRLTKVQRDDRVLEVLGTMLPDADALSPRERCWLYFALAKSYDDIGERDHGFAYLLEANAQKRRMIEYDEARELRRLDRVREVFTDELLAARRGLGDPSTLPVFVVGMPRSGTTLVEQILASHPAVFGAGERPELAQIVARHMARLGALRFPEAAWTITGKELRLIGEAYLAALRPLAPEAERIVDKMPANFERAGLINLVFPNARIIHLIRDPVDTCLSCFSKLFTFEQRFSYDLGELGRHYRAYERLMTHWRAVLPADVLLEVSYESLVENFSHEARRIVAHCGLPWDDACLEFHKTSRPVRTASLTQVRQPIYRGSVGRWRPNAMSLRPLLEALGQTADSPAACPQDN